VGGLLIFGCSGEQEKKRQKLIQDQIDLVQHQVEEIGKGRDVLDADVDKLRALLDSMNREVEKTDARIFAVKAYTPYLRELTTVGLGESPGKWVMTNPALNTGVYLLLAFFLFFVWLFWRIRHRQMEAAMNREVDGVIRRLSTEAVPNAQDSATPPKPAPKPESPPKPAQKPAEPKPAASTKAPAKPESKDRPEEKPAKKAAGKSTKTANKKAAAKKAAAKKAAPKSSAKKKKAAKKTASKKAPAKKCKVKNCNNKHRSKGFCNKHYQQWRKGALQEEVEED